jgi:hypothetical protein
LIPATPLGDGEPDALALDGELPVAALLAVDGVEGPPVHPATDRRAPRVTPAALPRPRCRRMLRL